MDFHRGGKKSDSWGKKIPVGGPCLCTGVFANTQRTKGLQRKTTRERMQEPGQEKKKKNFCDHRKGIPIRTWGHKRRREKKPKFRKKSLGFTLLCLKEPAKGDRPPPENLKSGGGNKEAKKT